MKGFTSVLCGFLFTLIAPLVVVIYSLNQTLFSAPFLTKSLKSSGFYPVLAEVLSKQYSGEQSLLAEVLDATTVAEISEQFIGDFDDYLQGKSIETPKIHLSPLKKRLETLLPTTVLNSSSELLSQFDQSVAVIPSSSAATIKHWYFFIQISMPFGIVVSLLTLSGKIILTDTIRQKLRAVMGLFLWVGVPGLLILLAPFSLSKLDNLPQWREFPPEILPIKGPLVKFIQLFITEIAIIQGIVFGIFAGAGIVCYILSLQYEEEILPPKPVTIG